MGKSAVKTAAAAAEPKPSIIQSTSEEGIIKDRFEKVRKRLRNDSSDDDSEEESRKTKGSQFEAMKRKMEKKMKSKLKAEKGGGGEKEKKDVEQYSMYSKRWRSEGQRKKAMEREEERWMQNVMKDDQKSSRNRSRSRSRSRGGRRSRSWERVGRGPRRRSRSEERRSHGRRDEDWRRSRRRDSSSEDYRGRGRRSRSPAENFSLASILKAELSHKEQVKREAERMKKEAIVMGAKALKSMLERKNS